jgi:hypothetical protein
MPFEKLVNKRGSRGNPEPLATLWVSGRLGFNKTATNRFCVTEYGHAEVHFNADTNDVGIKFLKKQGKHTVRVSHGISSSDISFIAAARLLGLSMSDKRHFNLKWDNGHGMVVFSLNT